MNLASHLYTADYKNQKPSDALSEQEAWYKKQNVMASNYRAIFESELGQIVLKDLIDKCLTRPIAMANDTQIQIGIREGRASLVRDILGFIQQSKGNDNG